MTFFKSIEFPELALTLAEAFDEPELLEDDADDAEESVKVLTSELAVNEPMAFVNGKIHLRILIGKSLMHLLFGRNH